MLWGFCMLLKNKDRYVDNYSLWWCIFFFSYCCNAIPQQKQLKRETVYFSSQFRDPVHYGREATVARAWDSCHDCICIPKAGANVCWCWAHTLHRIQSQILCPGSGSSLNKDEHQSTQSGQPSAAMSQGLGLIFQVILDSQVTALPLVNLVPNASLLSHGFSLLIPVGPWPRYSVIFCLNFALLAVTELLIKAT